MQSACCFIFDDTTENYYVYYGFSNQDRNLEADELMNSALNRTYWCCIWPNIWPTIWCGGVNRPYRWLVCDGK